MSTPDALAPVSKLQRLVQIPTVSDRDPASVDTEQFDRLLAELADLFPLVHSRLELTRVGTHGLLLHWRGASQERPVVLMAHLDVVPVDEDSTWTHPAFDGVISDGFLWGRGTLDDKGCVVGICEAVERLLATDFTPAQDVWLSFGATEEVSGPDAAEAVAVLRERGVRPWFVLDEGGAVAHDAFPGVAKPVAVIGVAEKGTTFLQLRADGSGGHSSTPARNGPTARIARAITRLERHQFSPRLPAPTVELFTRLAPHARGPLRPLLARAAQLQPVLARALVAAGHEPAALARTTIAVTTLSGSPALNVIASTAKAGVNLRIMPGESVAEATEHVRRAVHDDHVHVDMLEAGEPSPVSPYLDDPAFALLEQVVAEVFPDAVTSPYVQNGATDSRTFTEICERVYRFAPFRMTKAQRDSIHAHDERIGVADLDAGVEWYARLLRALT
ncbi:M20/M25/M40 family metallo-hydrolase [Nocardioides sp. Y6]|uniref:M20/M25/M40 family metallo-hydrolase n=1 Tax=Nocardioides malaquae TaxID=2773426 RepID=A0ABR9RW72_9ACTN|nr:M20/M25/M40 family metallo-hydrolase [Nocardioides malaquae]MBE7325773.1 M20/M25/M40 family metallo-hydrolase [Nocardioides malaquae]